MEVTPGGFRFGLQVVRFGATVQSHGILGVADEARRCGVGRLVSAPIGQRFAVP